MKIAILGGGFTGLSAAYYLRQKNHEVTIFEREKILGGLAVGFKEPGWNWTLERAYHHMFTTDSYTLDLAKDINFEGIFFKTPETASLYKIGENYPRFLVDTPIDFLKFPLLPFLDKIRTAIVLVFLKFSPPLSIYNTQTSQSFFTKFMGKKAWETIFGQPMRNKFGKYAGNILASFIWARVKVRTKSLGYIKGGFQAFVQYLERKTLKLGVEIKKGYEVQTIKRKKDTYTVVYKDPQGKGGEEIYDTLISTLPSPILGRIAGHLFPKSYFESFKKLQYLNAVVLIVESKEALLDKTYWLSICTEDIPTTVICQHTNFINRKHYGGHHIAYLGWYVSPEDPIWSMTEKEIVHFMAPHLKKLNSKFNLKKVKTHLFKAPFAQPVFDHNFLKNKPTFKTPLKNFYVANLDMTYPNDRGTNYAVKLGKEVSQLL